ncbi:MAG: hypothetical protein QXU32_13410 [Nitrososphaerales archaeon]
MDILKFAKVINSESDAIRFLDQCSNIICVNPFSASLADPKNTA